MSDYTDDASRGNNGTPAQAFHDAAPEQPPHDGAPQQPPQDGAPEQAPHDGAPQQPHRNLAAARNSDEEDPTLEFRRLFVYNLPFDVTQDTLRAFFQQFGPITSIELLLQKNGRAVAGAFVIFQSQESAANVLTNLPSTREEQRQMFGKCVIRAEYAAHQSRTRKYVKRKRVQKQDAQNIYNASLIDMSTAKHLAELDGYSDRTFYKIIQNKGEVTEKYREPDRHRKWTDPQIDATVEIIEHHPTYTLQEVEEASEAIGNPHVSLTTLQNYLDARAITYKQVEYHAVARNSEETKAARIDYVKDVQADFTHNYVYIDEVGYSIGTRRTRGRSRSGTPCIQRLPCLQSPNVSICAAIDGVHGVILNERRSGAFTAEDFKAFIVKLIRTCEEELKMKKVMLVFDNCRIHHAADLDSIPQIASGEFAYKFLPPYSPNLNPIENVFGMIKMHYQHLIDVEYSDRLVETYNAPFGTQMQSRQELLDEAFTRAISMVSNEDVANSFSHLREYFEKVLNHENI